MFTNNEKNDPCLQKLKRMIHVYKNKKNDPCLHKIKKNGPCLQK